jgi:hypothetical protein
MDNNAAKIGPQRKISLLDDAIRENFLAADSESQSKWGFGGGEQENLAPSDRVRMKFFEAFVDPQSLPAGL